jgi:F-type H+-transporting ATPase subunit epsilon
MLPTSLMLEIVTPERLVLAESVDEVVLPSVEGYMGVLPGHAPLLAKLDVGKISYRTGNRTRYLAISGGFAEVQPAAVSVLAETCEPAEEIDVERARAAKERAEAALRTSDSEHQFRMAEISLRKALSRIETQRHVAG